MCEQLIPKSIGHHCWKYVNTLYNVYVIHVLAVFGLCNKMACMLLTRQNESISVQYGVVANCFVL
jgi:hypothetical protein